MMLNALSPSVMDSVPTMLSAMPQLVNGHTVRLGGREYSSVKKMTSGGFGTIYTCKQDKQTKVLKVYFVSSESDICLLKSTCIHLATGSNNCLLN